MLKFYDKPNLIGIPLQRGNMTKHVSLTLIAESKQIFKTYQESNPVIEDYRYKSGEDRPADPRVLDYVAEFIKMMPSQIEAPIPGILSNGVMTLTWHHQEDTECQTAVLYIYDTGRMHLWMDCGEFAGQILGHSVDGMKATVESLSARLEPHFSK